MYKYVFIIFLVFSSTNILAQQKKIPDGYTLITLDGEDAYMNFDTGDVIRTVPLKSSQNYIYNTGDYENTSSFHIVEKGETLYAISRKYGVSVDKIIKKNNLTNTVIHVGQKLIIGSNSVKNNDVKASKQGNFYIVQHGDTLYKIAKNNNLTVSELKSLNKLSSNAIFVGQRLKI